MSKIQTAYGTSNQAFTITLNSLANGNSRQSTAINNTSTRYQDALIVLNVSTSTTNSTAQALVYAYGSTDGGSTYPEGISGTDGAVTLNSPTNLRLIGRLNLPVSSTAYESRPMSVSAAFGGSLPAYWGIVVTNSGVIGGFSSSGCSAVWQGVEKQIV
jgi:hypothetical protein